MSESPLLALPREIRDLIYQFALSPTGFVSPVLKREKTSNGDYHQRYELTAHDPSLNQPRYEPIPLPLRQTCRQIYAEIQGILYENNTITFANPCSLVWDADRIPAEYTRRIRQVWLRVDLKEEDDVDYLAEALQVLYNWVAQGGKLHTLTLNIMPHPEALVDLSKQNGAMKNPALQYYLVMLDKSWGKAFPMWKGVRRRLEVTAEHVPATCIGKYREAFKDLHQAFGGDFIVDGRVCYQDGFEILRPYQWRDYQRAVISERSILEETIEF